MDVPSPVQHADGRWLTPAKLKPICDQHNPGTKDIVWRTKGRGRGTWECRPCERQASHLYKKAHRIAKRTGTSWREAMSTAKAWSDTREPDAPSKITPAHPYDWTRLQLEREWGVPIEHWTRAQHRFHTRAIYHHLGWGDAALEGPMIRNGRVLDEPTIVAERKSLTRRAV